jgi:hypothetical protein
VVNDNKSSTGGGLMTSGVAESPAAKVAKVRRVFGRREAIVEGKTMRFEMRADGVHVRRKRGRKDRLVTFTDLVRVANGQGLLKL